MRERSPESAPSTSPLRQRRKIYIARRLHRTTFLHSSRELWQTFIMTETSERRPSNDSSQPATRADVNDAVDELAQITRKQIDRLDGRMDGLDQRLNRVESRLGSIERSQSAILDLMKSVDEKLKPLQDLPEQVERLEDAVFSNR